MARPALPLDQQRQPGRGVYQATCLRVNRAYAQRMAQLSDWYQENMRLAGLILDNGIDQLPQLPQLHTQAETDAYFDQRQRVLQAYQDRTQELSDELDQARAGAVTVRDYDLAAAKSVYEQARRQADALRKGITGTPRGGRRG